MPVGVTLSREYAEREECPSSVREQRPKWPIQDQIARRGRRVLIGVGWLTLFRVVACFPLITQRSLVQIQPPQPIERSAQVLLP